MKKKRKRKPNEPMERRTSWIGPVDRKSERNSLDGKQITKRRELLLRLLSDGNWHSLEELRVALKLGNTEQVHSSILGLRDVHGVKVEKKIMRYYLYRLTEGSTNVDARIQRTGVQAGKGSCETRETAREDQGTHARWEGPDPL